MRVRGDLTGRRTFLAVVAGTIMMLATLLAPAGAVLGAAPSPCRVTNVATGASFRTLQGGVNTAKRGATLRVTGLCKGTTSIARSLTIVGIRTKATGVPTLDGNAKSHTLSVASGAKVLVRGLVIKNGAAITSEYPGNSGGGIFNDGTLTLDRVVVEKNTALESGGGIRSEGTLKLIDTIVRNNTIRANGDGCGVAVSAGITMKGGRIAGNHPGPDGECYGGGLVVHGGAGVLSGNATVANNVAGTASGGGAAVDNAPASLTMRGRSSISGNAAEGWGGGVYTQGVFTLEAGTITGNTAGSGGGIFGTCAVVTVADPSADHVFGNTPALDQIFQVC